MVNEGYQYFIGIDISTKILDIVGSNLCTCSNIELVMADINDFIPTDTFDLTCSVLTSLHIEEKEKALRIIFHSLEDNRLFVLSVSKDDDWFDYGSRKVKLHPIELEEYVCIFLSTGFQIQSLQ
ncbi:methyltransferase domain-containing protein [Paenibacillus sp. ACRRX]|nr:methyltransferase domain-containing protein [Paenibacillus sp. ACRRX]